MKLLVVSVLELDELVGRGPILMFCGLEIAVDDASFVRRLERACDLQREGERL